MYIYLKAHDIKSVLFAYDIAQCSCIVAEIIRHKLIFFLASMKLLVDSNNLINDPLHLKR